MTRLAALLAIALAVSCAAVGEATQGTTEAAGVTLLAVLMTPLIAILSWPAWHWLGDKLSAWLTGTEQIRVAVLDEPVAGADALPRTELPLWGGSPLDSFTGGNMFWLIIIGGGLFLYFGGWTWLQSKRIKEFKEEDKEWVAALEKDRATHSKETAALAAKVEMLEKLLVVTPKRKT